MQARRSGSAHTASTPEPGRTRCGSTFQVQIAPTNCLGNCVRRWTITPTRTHGTSLCASTIIQAACLKTRGLRVGASYDWPPQGNSAFFDDLVAELADNGLTLSVAFIPDLHVRELSFSNGIAIVPDRGLDIYKGSGADGLRYCRNLRISWYWAVTLLAVPACSQTFWMIQR